MAVDLKALAALCKQMEDEVAVLSAQLEESKEETLTISGPFGTDLFGFTRKPLTQEERIRFKEQNNRQYGPEATPETSQALSQIAKIQRMESKMEELRKKLKRA